MVIVLEFIYELKIIFNKIFVVFYGFFVDLNIYIEGGRIKDSLGILGNGREKRKWKE